jgi:hypothetical protein
VDGKLALEKYISDNIVYDETGTLIDTDTLIEGVIQE